MGGRRRTSSESLAKKTNGKVSVTQLRLSFGKVEELNASCVCVAARLLQGFFREEEKE